MLQVFTEAEIRASVVFQLSELVNKLLKASRIAAGGADWDAMVAGACPYQARQAHSTLAARASRLLRT